MPKSSIALFLLVAPVIGLATPVWSTALQTPSTIIAFDGALAYRHVVELAGNIGTRASGSPQEEQAAGYIAQQMAALGYPVVMQTFPIFYWEKRSSSLTVSLSTSGALPRSIDHAVVAGSPSTPPQGTRAAVVHVGLGHPDDFRANDVVGKVALVRRGDLFFGEKVVNAAAAGAVLAIIYNNEAGGALPGDGGRE